jgi:hypothetical protein
MLSIRGTNAMREARVAVFNDKSRFKGLEFINLNTDRYFNQLRKPGRKAPAKVQQVYNFMDEPIEEEEPMIFDLG